VQGSPTEATTAGCQWRRPTGGCRVPENPTDSSFQRQHPQVCQPVPNSDRILGDHSTVNTHRRFDPFSVCSQEAVPDPPQRDVNAESILELGPVRLTENRQPDICWRSQL